MGARQQGDDARRCCHGRDHSHRRCRGAMDRRVSDLALTLGRNRPQLQPGGNRAHRHDGTRDVPLHPAGLTRRAGDGHAQRAQCLWHAGAVVVFFQPRLDDRWRGDRLVDGSDMGKTKSRRIFDRRGDRRHGAVDLPISRAAPRGLPLRRRLPLEGLRRAPNPQTHGPGGDRLIGRANQCGDQRHVCLRRRRRRSELAQLCLSAHATADRRVWCRGGNGDAARTLTRCDRWRDR